MDGRFGKYLRWYRGGISRRIRSISANLEGSIWNAKITQVVLFGLGAVILGTWANGISGVEALLKWEKAHLPPAEVVDVAMLSKGLRIVRDEKILQRAMRSLPTSLDDAGTFWAALNGEWVVYFQESSEELPFRIYCGDCKNRPVDWQPLGTGWKGLEQVLAKKGESARNFSVVGGKNVEWRDPREIRY